MIVEVCAVVGGCLGIAFVIGTEKKKKNAEVFGMLAILILLTGALFA